MKADEQRKPSGTTECPGEKIEKAREKAELEIIECMKRGVKDSRGKSYMNIAKIKVTIPWVNGSLRIKI